MTVERELAERHYAEHREKPFFGDLVDFITGGPLVALVLEGHEAVAAARQVIGATNPIEAAPGSIRGDFGLEVQTNLVHGSDSPESAAREIGSVLPRASDERGCSSSPPRSPQRRAILEQLGVAFEVVVPEVEELRDGRSARAGGSRTRRRKARAVDGRAGAGRRHRRGARRADLRQAGATPARREAFLRALSGREHEVMSGIALR